MLKKKKKKTDAVQIQGFHSAMSYIRATRREKC